MSVSLMTSNQCLLVGGGASPCVDLAQNATIPHASETHLEDVLLILQTLLLLVPQLVQTIIVAIKVDELVLALGDGLADLFADIVQFLARLHDARSDQLQLGSERFCSRSASGQTSYSGPLV